MLENIRVSIIIPVYNVELYLQECVFSIINQTYTNFEILLIDDGSTDGSGDLCDKIALKDARIRVYHKHNEGLSVARNYGLTKAKGYYVFFLDSDDFLCNNYVLEKIILQCENRNADFVIFNYYKYYQKENITIANTPYADITITSNDKYSILEAFSNQGIYPMAAWTKVLKRNFLLENGISFIPSILSEDIPWFVDLISKSDDFFVLNEYVVSYRRQVPGAITNTFSMKKIKDLIFIIETCVGKAKFLDNKLSSFIYAFMLYEYIILIALYNNVHIENDRRKLRLWFYKYKWLLRNSDNLKNKLAKYCLLFLGVNVTSEILNWYIKKRVNRK